MGKEIDEAIADAMAEEEVEKERIEEMLKQGIKDAEKDAREDFKDVLREHFSTMKPSVKVEVDLDEYIALKQKETDYDRVLTVIMKHLRLSYNDEYISTDGDTAEIADVLKALYPKEYDNLYNTLLKRKEFERNAGV